MLENWVWDKTVLDRFAAHYLHPEQKIPAEVLDKLKEAKRATVGTFYRRQLSFGLLDLALHSQDPATFDPIKQSNQILSDVLLPVPDGTAFVAYFGHLTGYDAGYYGYAWADAIAADMATEFEHSDRGYMDPDIGMRLRREIYAQGNRRDVQESIRRFLGRDRSLKPFLNSIGIQ
jgi:thimet oligopeptidase